MLRQHGMRRRYHHLEKAHHFYVKAYYDTCHLGDEEYYGERRQRQERIKRERFARLHAKYQHAARYPWLSVVTACSDDPTYPGEQGDISDVVARYGPWNEHDFFVSGSGRMVKATLRTLAELQVPSVRIKYDSFSD